jgi:hypothetical protein
MPAKQFDSRPLDGAEALGIVREGAGNLEIHQGPGCFDRGGV